MHNTEKLVTREQLIHDIWLGNHYTGEKGLTHAICHLRKVLKTGNIPAKIITVPKKGYLITDTTLPKEPVVTLPSPRPVLLKAERAEATNKFSVGYPFN